MLSGKEIPDYWQAFDNLTDPTVISQGILRGTGVTPPDIALFADWGTLADDPWLPALKPAQGFMRKGENDPDTAMAVLWNPVTLEPGKTMTYVTYYGIGYITVNPGVITLGLSTPAETTFEDERTQPFTVTGYLQNTGKFEGHDVVMTLTVPEGLQLCGGSPQSTTQSVLKPGEEMQGSWVLIANGKSGGKKQLTLSVASANIEANHADKGLNVIVPTSSFYFTPDKQRVLFDTDKPKPIIAEVNMNSATHFSGFSLTIKFDPTVIRLLDVSRGRDIVEVTDGKERPLQWKVDKTNVDNGVIIFSGKRINDQGQHMNDLTQWEVNLATLSFYTVKAGSTALTITGAEFISNTGDTKRVDVKELKNGEVDIVVSDAPAASSH